uniref:Reverse transcriptase Ty1/copia-type domain-containing protein n=1 Tax=Glycine max TaxID=3847 RepID=A0A0R0KFB0_SOYBN
MKDAFEMTDLGRMTFFLSMQVYQKQNEIFLCQEKYANEVLKKFNMAGCKPAATPMNQKEKFCKEDGAEKVDEKLYRSLIGCVMYLSASRPDILHAVSLLSRELNSSEALELLSLYAFNQNHLDMEYYKLLKRVVNYSQGIPLVVKVLGHLCEKDKEVWESQLDKLKNMPNIDIYNAMRLSYDDLDHKEQKILLDLACFFMGLNMKVDHIKVLLKDSEKDDSVAVGLERLKDKALITISEDNVISMHDIKQEKASEIVRLESIVDPGNRSRLMHPDDTYEVLKYNKGTEAIRSIRADLSVIRKLHKYNQDGFPLLPCGLQSFPVELRYLAWMHYPLKSLAENFSVENLNLVNLKEVKVSGSENLKELPDLSEATNLEVLDINFCPQLTSVTPSIFSLNRLERLSVAYCSLTKITSKNHLSSLRYLNLESCKKLREFSVASENMIELDLSSTCVNAFTSSFGYCTALKTVLFPSVAQQFNENRKEVLFWNCLKLDEDSLKAVKLNTHINLRKFAYQHLSAPDENFDDYNRTYGSDQVKYVYPGRSVPELTFYITVSDDEDESKKDSINIYMSNSIVWAASDHVCVIYDQ